MSTGKNSTTQKTKKISMQLLKILIPMIALFIIAVAVIIFINARTIIIKDGKKQLQEESAANANDIGRTMDNIKGYYNGLSDI
jgi:methyl-accepting chemotaxis protein